MKQYTKSAVALLLALIFIFSSTLPIFAVEVRASGQPSSYSTSSNSGERDVVCTTLNGTRALSYYTGSYTYDNLSELSSSTLLSNLRTLLTSTHKKNSSYDDCKNMADQTDCENENGKVLLLYTSVTSTAGAANSGWNREHVWPKSLGGYETSGPGADLHHIRPTDNQVNSYRGSLKFGNESSKKAIGSNAASGVLGGYYGSYFEPLDNVKGDVARICLYMYVRYGGSYSKCSSITNVFQSVDLLLSWCALDPVDTWEMGRNEVVAAYQGNRNVFIDYPELAWKLFNKTVPSNMTTPSGGSSSSGGSTSCSHSNTTIKNQASATCGNAGYSGDTYCNDCNSIIRNGTTISATGNHIYGAWVESGNTQIRTCSVCGNKESQAIPCKHTVTAVKNKADATCGKNGYTGDTYCVACGEILEKGTTITKTGVHSYNSWVVDVATNTQTRTCYVCGDVQTESADLENCTHESTQLRNQLDATCGKDGYTGDLCCTRCNEVITKGQKIKATENHVFGEQVVITQPTYINSGIGKQVCEGCGIENVNVIPPLVSESELTAEQIIYCLDSETQQILLLLTLGMTDRIFVNELSE